MHVSPVGKTPVTRQDERSLSAPADAQVGPTSPRPTPARLFSSDDASTSAQWSAAIIAAAAALLLSRGTSFHQLAIGVLGSLICAFVGLSLIETASRLVSMARSHLRPVDLDAKPPLSHTSDRR
jgi:hypothetical protein